MEEKEIYEIKKSKQSVYGGRECNKVIRTRKAILLKWKYCKTEGIFGIQKGGD
jgi:hypothetical protein